MVKVLILALWLDLHMGWPEKDWGSWCPHLRAGSPVGCHQFPLLKSRQESKRGSVSTGHPETVLRWIFINFSFLSFLLLILALSLSTNTLGSLLCLRVLSQWKIQRRNAHFLSMPLVLDILCTLLQLIMITHLRDNYKLNIVDLESEALWS